MLADWYSLIADIEDNDSSMRLNTIYSVYVYVEKLLLAILWSRQINNFGDFGSLMVLECLGE